MNNEQKEIINYNSQTGEPIYERENKNDGFGMASIIIGIISILMAFVSFMLIFPLSIVGLILGYSSPNKQGKAKLGIILNNSAQKKIILMNLKSYFANR